MLEAHKRNKPRSDVSLSHGTVLTFRLSTDVRHTKRISTTTPAPRAAADDVPRLQRTAFEYARAISAGHGRARAGAGVIGRRRRNMGTGWRQGR